MLVNTTHSVLTHTFLLISDAESDEEDEGEDSWDTKGKGGSSGREKGRERGRSSMGPSICLLTTKACGQGITLTGQWKELYLLYK